MLSIFKPQPGGQDFCVVTIFVQNPEINEDEGHSVAWQTIVGSFTQNELEEFRENIEEFTEENDLKLLGFTVASYNTKQRFPPYAPELANFCLARLKRELQV